MLYDMTLCATCGKKGAHSWCRRCLQAAYCGKSCQKVHWRAGHKRECIETTDAAAPTPATGTGTGIADAAAHQSPGNHPPDPTVSTADAATSTHATELEAATAHRPVAGTSSSTAASDSIAHAADGDRHDDEHECPIVWTTRTHFPAMGLMNYLPSASSAASWFAAHAKGNCGVAASAPHAGRR